MEDIKLMPVVKEKIIDKCLNCGSSQIIPMNNFNHNFDDVDLIDDGVLCDNCNSFHYMNDDNLTYEYVYKDIFSKVKEVRWKISDN